MLRQGRRQVSLQDMSKVAYNWRVAVDSWGPEALILVPDFLSSSTQCAEDGSAAEHPERTDSERDMKLAIWLEHWTNIAMHAIWLKTT